MDLLIKIVSYILPYLINRDFMDVTFHPEVALRLIIKN